MREKTRPPEASYYRARYYDPNIGRFVGGDPQRFEGGVNFYVYTLENPVLFIDPFGLDIWLEGELSARLHEFC
jgi:RHS repeat-associated protein